MTHETAAAGPGMTAERLGAFGDAWRLGDVDALMSFMTEDCVFRSSVGPGPGADFHGPEAVRRGFELMLEYDVQGEGRDGALHISGNFGASTWSYATRPRTAGRRS